MKKILKNWAAVMKELGIEEVQRTVYKVKGRKARLTKDAAINEGLKQLANRLDGPCQCGMGDEITPPDYCGCYERKEKMVERMLPLAKALPASLIEWNAKIKAYEEAGYLDDGIWSNKC